MKKIFTIFALALIMTISCVNAEEPEDTKSMTVTYICPANITFEGEGQTFQMSIQVGQKLEEPSHPNKEGYIFDGWYLDDHKWDFNNDTVENHMTLVAKYVPIEGRVINITNPELNNPRAIVDITVDDIPFTEQDYLMLENGYDMNINLIVKVETPTNVPELEKQLLTEKTNEIKETFAQYIDIELIKTINSISENIHETNHPVKIIIEIPEEYRKENREYTLLRAHDGVVDVMFSGRPEDGWTISFYTDKFSTYALIYKDTEEYKPVNPEHRIPNTGVDGGIVLASGIQQEKKIDVNKILLIISITLNLLTIAGFAYYAYRQHQIINEHINNTNVHKKPRTRKVKE